MTNKRYIYIYLTVFNLVYFESNSLIYGFHIFLSAKLYKFFNISNFLMLYYFCI